MGLKGNQSTVDEDYTVKLCLSGFVVADRATQKDW